MALGIDVWFDQWEIGIGDSLRRKMESGLSNCTHFLVLLTPQSVGKPWVETEIDAGFLKSVGGQARFVGIRVGVPIEKLSPFLQTLRCPEVDLTDNSLVAALIAEIHGVSTKPALGAPPTYVRAPASRIGRWSDSAIAVAEYLVRNSKFGTKHDPMTTPGKISAAIGLPVEDVRFGAMELRDARLVEESQEINGDTFWPEVALFVEFDRHFLDFVPADDAAQIAHRVINEGIRQIKAADLAIKFPDWSTRRLNSALNHLEVNRLVQPLHGIGSAPYTMMLFTVTDYTRRFARDRS